MLLLNVYVMLPNKIHTYKMYKKGEYIEIKKGCCKIGPTGPTGLPGEAVTGTTGPPGVSRTGPTGPKGHTGNSGTPGRAGFPGPTGPTGPTGEMTKGPTGPIGGLGGTGPTGPSCVKETGSNTLLWQYINFLELSEVISTGTQNIEWVKDDKFKHVSFVEDLKINVPTGTNTGFYFTNIPLELKSNNTNQYYPVIINRERGTGVDRDGIDIFGATIGSYIIGSGNNQITIDSNSVFYSTSITYS